MAFAGPNAGVFWSRNATRGCCNQNTADDGLRRGSLGLVPARSPCLCILACSVGRERPSNRAAPSLISLRLPQGLGNEHLLDLVQQVLVGRAAAVSG